MLFAKAQLRRVITCMGPRAQWKTYSSFEGGSQMESKYRMLRLGSFQDVPSKKIIVLLSS